ncbi:unnamed protein product [Litomosoides sigmodontis]|uniref:Pepsin inhibitor-3-like repeated domain-containing protein n=1 Tax=Litomosoides sigmodontis TaxID=42156 RepID=A0A3P6SQS2_LITSI|nr:unnamed protein product [Litomosoides sigmodontis]
MRVWKVNERASDHITSRSACNEVFIAMQSVILWELCKGQSVTSGNFSIASAAARSRNANSFGAGRELSATESGRYCVVQDGQIYVNGRYTRNMKPDDYSNLNEYRQNVARWSESLVDQIQLSFPWDPRNPQHNKFPWNPAAFPGKRRRRAAIPFPPLPQFCYE